jgi:hypothetical protein
MSQTPREIRGKEDLEIERRGKREKGKRKRETEGESPVLVESVVPQ